jgi:cation transport ATPase
MKQLLSKIFGGAGTNVAEGLSNIVDKFVHTKEEKAQFEKEMTELFMSHESEMEKNITERWKTDMESSSWLSKNVRPMVLIFLVVSTVLLVFIDAGVIHFEVKANWVDLLQLVLITVISAYFGGRSFEKIKNKK